LTNSDNPDKYEFDYSVSVKYDGIKPILWDEIEDLNRKIELTYGATMSMENTSGHYVTPHYVEQLSGYVPRIEEAEVTKYGVYLKIQIRDPIAGYGENTIVPAFIEAVTKWATKNKLKVKSFHSINEKFSSQWRDTYGVSVSFSHLEESK
jgi:hypothetical protein